MQPQRFRVTVRGTLSPKFAAAFEGLTVRSAGGATTLSGVAEDQAQLFGVLERVADYGLELTDVRTEETASTARSVEPGSRKSGWSEPGSAQPTRRPRPPRASSRVRTWSGFLATFAAGWWMLDHFATSPPTPASALTALAAAALALAAGSVVLLAVPVHGLPLALGLLRPDIRALGVAAGAGTAAIATFLLVAAAADIPLTLRHNWPAVLLGVLLFHGVAEEIVWRGFAFARLRRGGSFTAAVCRSMPLIALTHVPIIIGNGWLVGGLAVLTAAVTCIPFAYLWEHGRRTIWAPALLHALIDSWQLFERDYPPTFSAVVMLSAIVVAPLAVWGLGRRFITSTSVPGDRARPLHNKSSG